MTIIDEIKELKKEKNAVILGHYYQLPEIQEISDFVGDSLALAERAATTEADVIVMCGVHFMAETAKIINPKKRVLLPDLAAGCSLAESCSFDDLKRFKEQHPDHIVVTYINSTAETKTLTDITCTSGNAVQLINSLPKDQKIIFAPDKNLGTYINKVTGRDMILWQGTCTVHDQLHAENILKLKQQHPDAKLLVHPECNPAVLSIADFVGSTNAMINFSIKDSTQKYIVASETGIQFEMTKRSPDKTFIIVPYDESCACNDCHHMKLNTLEKLRDCLKNNSPEIILSQDIITMAAKPINRMMDMSRKLGLI